MRVADPAGMLLRDRFHRFAVRASEVLGTPWSFLLAVMTVVVWMVTGPLFHYSDTWQLAINTGTTVVTFLMVFLIQNTQNRDARALHLKLDELIRATRRARNELIELEALSDSDLERLHQELREARDATHPTAVDGRTALPRRSLPEPPANGKPG
jgi:low affinity Fe/Cu permease